jgi:hypothetical protein
MGEKSYNYVIAGTLAFTQSVQLSVSLREIVE